MSNLLLSYWRNLKDIIPVKVEFVEAGLASGLPRAADHDRHSHGQASSFSFRDDPQGAPRPAAIKTLDYEGAIHYDATTRFVTAANSLLC